MAEKTCAACDFKLDETRLRSRSVAKRSKCVRGVCAEAEGSEFFRDEGLAHFLRDESSLEFTHDFESTRNRLRRVWSHGQFVVAELRKLGWTAILSGRDQAQLNSLAEKHPGSKVRAARVEDAASLDRAISGASAVINCADRFSTQQRQSSKLRSARDSLSGCGCRTGVCIGCLRALRGRCTNGWRFSRSCDGILRRAWRSHGDDSHGRVGLRR